LSRAFQEHQVRNYASFIATFKAFANDPNSPMRLHASQFAMMDMLGVAVEEKGDQYAFTTEQSHSTVVFEEKSPIFFKLMLCQFCDGSVAPPVFLVADRSVKPDRIVKLQVPGLSQYGGMGAVGHVWVGNPTGG
jgi:hypothetical protein